MIVWRWVRGGILAVVNGCVAAWLAAEVFDVWRVVTGQLSFDHLLVPEGVRQLGAVFDGPPYSSGSCVVMGALASAVLLTPALIHRLARDLDANGRGRRDSWAGIAYGAAVVYGTAFLFLPLSWMSKRPDGMTWVSVWTTAFGMMAIGGTVFVAISSPLVGVAGAVLGRINGSLVRKV